MSGTEKQQSLMGDIGVEIVKIGVQSPDLVVGAIRRRHEGTPRERDSTWQSGLCIGTGLVFASLLLRLRRGAAVTAMIPTHSNHSDFRVAGTAG